VQHDLLDLLHRDPTPKQAEGSGEQLVRWAAAFLASDEARWITGVTLPVESGVLSVTPLMMAPYLRAVPEPEG
jgi:NAD(P)-dependent dehydrogenase (short-subunit alcohol dehydrogenase family)